MNTTHKPLPNTPPIHHPHAHVHTYVLSARSSPRFHARITSNHKCLVYTQIHVSQYNQKCSYTKVQTSCFMHAFRIMLSVPYAHTTNAITVVAACTYSTRMLHESHKGTPGLYHKYRLKNNTPKINQTQSELFQHQIETY